MLSSWSKGREAADEVNVPGLHDRLLQMLGRLHFRTSYSQNVLRHSVEVAFISGLIAEMLGMDADLARRCGLLHDIGKAADHELEGGHPEDRCRYASVGTRNRLKSSTRPSDITTRS